MIAPNMKDDLMNLYYKEVVLTASLIQYDLMMMGAANKVNALLSEYTRLCIRVNNCINNIVDNFTCNVVSDQDISNLRNSTIDYAKEKISRLAHISEYVDNKGLDYYIQGDNGDVEFRLFSHSEIIEVAKGNFSDIEMHHESSLSLLRADKSNETLQIVINPDNINPYSTNAHFSQHGGNWRNPTDDLNATIKEAIWQSAKKSALFIAGSVLLDCLTPLRDPTITLVVTGARLTWNIGSWSFKYNENKQEQIAIAQGKIIFYYKKALDTVL